MAVRQDGEGFFSMGSLDHLEAGLRNEVRCVHPEQLLVFDDQTTSFDIMCFQARSSSCCVALNRIARFIPSA